MPERWMRREGRLLVLQISPGHGPAKRETNPPVLSLLREWRFRVYPPVSGRDQTRRDGGLRFVSFSHGQKPEYRLVGGGETQAFTSAKPPAVCGFSALESTNGTEAVCSIIGER